MRTAIFAAAALAAAAFAAPASADVIVADTGWTQLITFLNKPTEGSPFTFTVAKNSTLTFLDCCQGGDVYQVSGDLAGTTTFYAGAGDAFGALDTPGIENGNYSGRWASADFSKLVFDVGPGTYTFDIIASVGLSSINGVDVRLDTRPGRQTPGVPEPTTWALLIAGFGLAGGSLRRRRTAALSL